MKVVPSGKVLPLLDAREKALNQKKHVYEGLKEENYIKNPMVEFFRNFGMRSRIFDGI